MVREIDRNELSELLELYLHLHEKTMPDMTEFLSNTWDTIIQDKNHHIIVNKVEDKCLITLDNLLSGSDSVGDVVVANITADILIILSKDILSHLKSGSKLILSGILREKATEVIETYLPLGFKLVNSESKGEWVALMMEKL